MEDGEDVPLTILEAVEVWAYLKNKLEDPTHFEVREHITNVITKLVSVIMNAQEPTARVFKAMYPFIK